MELEGEKRHSPIIHNLLKVILEFNRVERENRRYGTDQTLFFSEIHLIQFIGENSGLHISSMAERLGITKGAVSQIARKLEAKGMITKETDTSNQTRILLRLTPAGKKAYKAHEAVHAQLNGEIEDILSNASVKERAFLESFLSTLRDRLSGYS